MVRVHTSNLLLRQGRGRLGREQVTGRDASQHSVDRDRVLPEPVPHLHDDAHPRARFARELNHHSETQPVRIQPRRARLDPCRYGHEVVLVAGL